MATGRGETTNGVRAVLAAACLACAAAGCRDRAQAVQPPRAPPAVQQPSRQQAPQQEPPLAIVESPVPFGPERERLTLEYIRAHYDPAARDIAIEPRMIVVHWTAGSTLGAALATFARTTIEPTRQAVRKASELNVSTHYLVDRDGTVHRLMPDTRMARHCIGLNRAALAIENVGGADGFPLTEAQLAGNAALVRDLKRRHPALTHLIGHLEYRAFEGHPYFEERDPKYRNVKPDPGRAFMEQLRARVADLGLRGPPPATDQRPRSRHSQ